MRIRFWGTRSSLAKPGPTTFTLVAASIAPQLGRGNALDWMYAQLTSSPSQKGMTLLLAVSAAGYRLDCLITGARIAFCCRYSGSGTIGFNERPASL